MLQPNNANAIQEKTAQPVKTGIGSRISNHFHRKKILSTLVISNNSGTTNCCSLVYSCRAYIKVGDEWNAMMLIRDAARKIAKLNDVAGLTEVAKTAFEAGLGLDGRKILETAEAIAKREMIGNAIVAGLTRRKKKEPVEKMVEGVVFNARADEYVKQYEKIAMCYAQAGQADGVKKLLPIVKALHARTGYQTYLFYPDMIEAMAKARLFKLAEESLQYIGRNKQTEMDMALFRIARACKQHDKGNYEEIIGRIKDPAIQMRAARELNKKNEGLWPVGDVVSHIMEGNATEKDIMFMCTAISFFKHGSKEKARELAGSISDKKIKEWTLKAFEDPATLEKSKLENDLMKMYFSIVAWKKGNKEYAVGMAAKIVDPRISFITLERLGAENIDSLDIEMLAKKQSNVFNIAAAAQN
ncbi:MAG: hypothetical protein WC506_03025 [Candidatus Micrarchaeia archaeon]